MKTGEGGWERKIWLIRQNGERSMNQAVSSCRHSRFGSECDSNAFRYRLLLLTQVLTATTNRSREYDGNQRRSVYFHRTASSGWDRTCWSICFNLWSRCACLSDTTDSKVKYNKIKGKQMQVHANLKCCTAEFRRGSGRSPVVGQLPSKVKPKANDLDKRHVEGILTSIKSPYCGQDSHGTWKSSRVQEE